MSDIIDFNIFKKIKEEPEPLFQDPTLITLGYEKEDGVIEEIDFYLVANLVYEGEQYLALQEDGDDGLILVKAVVGTGNPSHTPELIGIDAIAEEDYETIRNVFEKAFELQEEAAGKEDSE